ncbi:hypothetical protein C8Q70DRAFT_120306 [Cubamyces menziesii]|nr:hypothetical protein C8Q70DRAFT_120306 [Cubamyces menziesii]
MGIRTSLDWKLGRLECSLEPRPSTKPEPIGNDLLIFLLTTCMLCAVFLLWRRASQLRSVVAHQLGTIPNNEGRIRLSLDEGPSAREFLDDDYDDDNERVGEDEPLAVTADRLRKAVDSADSELQQSTLVFAADADEPPPLPPKA